MDGEFACLPMEHDSERRARRCMKQSRSASSVNKQRNRGSESEQRLAHKSVRRDVVVANSVD